MSPKMYLYAGIAILLGLALWKAGDSLYDAGVNAERGRVAAAAAKASEAARKADQASTTASEGVADTSRQEAGQAASDTRATTTETIETIRYVYRDRPVPAGCPAPGPVPDVVLERFAAGRAAAAAARGLRPAVGR